MMANIWWSLPLTLIVFFAARKLAARYKFPLLNPLLVAMVVIIPFLMLTGISYDSYFKGSEVLNDLLQPAVVALAYPLYEQLHQIRARWKSIITICFIGTTDDPIDSLEHHAEIAKDGSFTIKVLPSWRPDKAFNIEQATFNDYMAKLGEVSDTDIRRFADLQTALTKRLDHFAAHGCKVSDHALDVVMFAEANEAELDSILARRLAGETLSEHEVAQFKTAVLVFLGAEYARRGWVQQYHIGALRNNNLRQFKLLGPDVGFDSINDRPMAEELSKLLSKQNEENLLPKTILYCLNPRDNEVLGTMIGNFQGEGMPGKMQFGSGWWFNDQKDGMERQMTQLAQLGLLSRFVGMLTDSRSFLSYTRHEYFRRILCQMIGRWVEAGEAPADINLLGEMVKNICFNNARDYFAIELN